MTKLLRYTLPLLLFSVIWGSVEFLLPIRFSEANLSVENIAMLFFLSSLVSIIIDIPSGKISDKIGREKMIVYSMIVIVIALTSLYLSGSIYIFLIASILIGVSYGLNWSPILAFVGDRSAKNNYGSTFGDFFTLSAFGEAMAPILIAIIIIYSSTVVPFFILALVSIICMFAFMSIQVKRKNLSTADSFRNILNGFSYRHSFELIRRFLGMSIFLMILGFFVAFFWESVWFTQPLIGFYENTIFDSALIIAAFSIPALLFSKPIGKFIDDVGEKRTFFFSVLGIIGSFILFYFSNDLATKLIFIFTASVGVLGTWLVMDVMTTKIYKKSERGEFFGILETVRDASYAITPLFIGFAYKLIGLNGVFVINSIMAFLLLLFGIIVFRSK